MNDFNNFVRQTNLKLIFFAENEETLLHANKWDLTGIAYYIMKSIFDNTVIKYNPYHSWVEFTYKNQLIIFDLYAANKDNNLGYAIEYYKDKTHHWYTKYENLSFNALDYYKYINRKLKITPDEWKDIANNEPIIIKIFSNLKQNNITNV